MILPTTMDQWVLRGTDGFSSLKLEQSAIPEVGEFDVLIKFHAASLNYRDLMIAKGTYYWPLKEGIVPVSDFAGEVLCIGSKVTRFQKGQRVAGCVHQTHIAGSLSKEDAMNAVGSLVDGALRKYGVYNEHGLVKIPENLSYREGATLPCAALTAWNSLYGAKPLLPGNTVLTLGSGGVSVFAIQFALVGGAQVISTTSSNEKAAVLKKLGAHHVINYKENANWGNTARKLSYGGLGADYVIEVSGPNTMEQSSIAAAIDGMIAVIGTRGGRTSSGALAHTALVTTRRIMIGNRLQFEEMNRAIEINNIKPIIDSKVFKFEEAPEAFQYLWDQKAVGKVVIDIE
ncbi:putative quinone oxidoreductase [Glonium stellatum]|uniref:Putative quinone oxidoreductase n=1 Tax=Glonium stellatum TaxID=574774 RepID=A0A8E2JX82_9PEZI|nr:putative quinone oxidoreductase [Glonium stellatum]